MILLNQPWSLYERRLASERRRQALCTAIFAAAFLLLGLGLGVLILSLVM